MHHGALSSGQWRHGSPTGGGEGRRAGGSGVDRCPFHNRRRCNLNAHGRCQPQRHGGRVAASGLSALHNRQGLRSGGGAARAIAEAFVQGLAHSTALVADVFFVVHRHGVVLPRPAAGFPVALRDSVLLPVLAPAPLSVMLFWLGKVRFDHWRRRRVKAEVQG